MKTQSRKVLWLIVVLLSVSSLAHADEADKPKPPEPLGLQVLAGGAINLTGAPKTSRYYKITFRDQMIGSRGEQSKNSDSTHQFLLAPGKADTNSLLLDLTHGTGAVNQDQLNALGIDKLKLPQLTAAGLRTSIWLNGTLDGRQGSGAFGFETRPLHPAYSHEITNWIIPGVNITHQWKPGSDKTTGQLTYRAFVGYSHWDPTGPEPFSYEDVRKWAPTQKVLEEKFGPGSTDPTGNRTLYEFLRLQRGFFMQPMSQAAYEAAMATGYQNAHDTYLYQPSYALWLESAGWFDMIGKDHPRVQTMLALVGTVWKDFSVKARSSFQIRYETGFDRATPGTRIHRVIANVGLAF